MDDAFIDADFTEEADGIVPLVSVLISTFKHERYIEEAMRSALSQKTDFPFEILVGDDHSPDRTAEIARTIAAEEPGRVRVF